MERLLERPHPAGGSPASLPGYAVFSHGEQDAREPPAGCVRSITPPRPSRLLNIFLHKRARNRQRSKTRRIESQPQSKRF